MKNSFLIEKIFDAFKDTNLDDIMFIFFMVSSARGLSCMDQYRIFAKYMSVFREDDDEYDRLCFVIKHSLYVYSKSISKRRCKKNG